MRSIVTDSMEKARVAGPAGGIKGRFYGTFVVCMPETKTHLRIVASEGCRQVWESLNFPDPPFEHVSVTVVNEARCPTWEEMCFVKDLFWLEEETVLQYHPPKSQYVNKHKHCLHLWKPVDFEIPVPPMKTIA